MGLLETMIEYYLPGLDASKLNELQFINKAAQLLYIRQLERENKVDEVIKKLTGE